MRRRIAEGDAKEINGWDIDGKVHREENRTAEPFLNFVRGTVGGGPARQNYKIPAEPLLQVSVTAQRRGTIEFQTPTGGQISVLGIRFNPANTFSTVPPIAK